MDPDTWHVLIRNLSGLGFLAIAAHTLVALINGPVVRGMLAKWLDLPADSTLPQADLNRELVLLRYQLEELSEAVHLGEQTLKQPVEERSQLEGGHGGLHRAP